ncbi:methylcrotonoyl-CoA carboxylase subunit alpha, mitochondrial [Paraglaciecola mesophila KMM 241]|uniref:Biotin carboxylase n=1 Tax=Paraglaciecola mesophila KMM 241 TaxID=1128912 RepID=K6ZQ41_9ALTE|nr:acetyl/propionyl/methylcrotonyl-CoA carboxylase subunit alpha [Paraglaciecola mesophila]GAC25450.1 methylcrotonoyl-CoA carboxylase subunit alpha, mitochondrial [Paraglaciecola mesophila KMM 241]
MIKKLLIANRGEICCRIINTAKRMGIQTVALYSDADKNALHVKMADEAIHIGPSPSNQSYLKVDKVLAAAKATGADAIHPGYGFLSENAEFAKACADNNIIFVGPPVGAIEAMGSKSAAKHIMQQADVPLVPGYHGDDQSPALIKKHADDMGYPVLLKAAAGGGGKGMRQVWSEDEFDDALAAAKREAMSSFNDDIMLVEKYLTQPRHVEVQVFCDHHGNGVHIFERDCSVQRRHQKVIEEAPAFKMQPELRAAMGDAALKAAQAINYVGAGTVEFLLDTDGSFYFMEMNTRLQVEHPVSEMISGQDLVEWQLRVAANEILPKTQDQLHINGHAFEARIYAEDPDNEFLPATGKLHLLETPQESKHVRIDSGVVQGDEVSVYYDPMIAKLIVWDTDRERALARLSQSLAEYRIDGVITNIPFLRSLIDTQAFKDEEIDTRFIETHHDEIFHKDKQINEHLILNLAMYLSLNEQAVTSPSNQDSQSPWGSVSDWRANECFQSSYFIQLHDEVYETKVERLKGDNQAPHQQGTFIVKLGEQTYQCEGQLAGNRLLATVNGHSECVTINKIDHDYALFHTNGMTKFSHIQKDLGVADETDQHGAFVAPMNGTVVTLLVDPKQSVKKGQTLMIMEAMKMEHAIKATQNGHVQEFYYQAGELVDGGTALLDFIADEEPLS